MPKTAEEKFNEAVREGWNPNEVLNHMRNSKNDEYRSWVKQTWESPEAIPTPDGSMVSRIPKELDPELKDRLRQRKSQRQEKMDTAAGGAFQVPDWMFSPEFLTGAAGAAAGLGTAYTAAGAHAGMTPMEAAKGAASTFMEDVNQRLANRYKPTVQQAPAAPAPQPTFPQATTQQPALPQGYGQQTMNAPTGAPAVPPTAGAGPQPVAPAPVDPLMAERIRKAKADADYAEQRLAKLQTPATTAPASAKGSVSEADLKLLQQHGFNETSKQLQAKEAASKLAPSVDAINKNTPAAEVQGAVNVVKQQEQKQIVGEAGKAVKPEYPKKEVFKTVPEGYVFRPDVGNLDRSLGNVLGLEHREYARELFNQGKPFGHSSDVNKDVSRITTEYFKHLQSQVPETILGRDARKLQNIPSDFGTFAKGTDFGKGAKVAGTLGTLLAATSAANAASKGDTAPAKELGFDLATGAGLASILGGPAAFVGSLGLGSSGLNKDEEKQLAYRQKVGSGRGIAPPSSYQR